MQTPRLSPGTQLSLMRATNASAHRTAGDGRVEIVPSPDGTVHLNVHTIDGQWVTDHICLPDDVDAKLIRALELRAKKHEGVKPIAIVR